MNWTLEAARGHTRALLGDPDGLVYADALVDQALRQAVAEVAGAAGGARRLAGLDGAVESNLSEEERALAALGAAGYASAARTASRSEQPDLASAGQAGLAGQSNAWLERFSAGLLRAFSAEARRRAALRAGEAPYARWGGEEGPCTL